MFKIVPTAETEKFLEFLRKEAPTRVKELEYVVAAQVAAFALDHIKKGIRSDIAYIKAYKDSLHLVQIATNDVGAAGIVGTLPVDYASSDVKTTLLVFPSGARDANDPGATILSNPMFQPWALDALPPIRVLKPVLLRLRHADVVQARRAANITSRPVVDAALNKAGVTFSRAFSPDGGAYLDVQDLALQLEHGGDDFPDVPHWRSVVTRLKDPHYVGAKVLKELREFAEKSLTDPSYTELKSKAPRVDGSVTEGKMGELNRRPGGLTDFASIVGGYPLT